MSKLLYSSRFINILNKMSNNDMANTLLNIRHSESDDISYNYIDIGEDKELVSFTPQRKVVEKLDNMPEIWQIVTNAKYLLDKDSNRRIFRRLRFDRDNFELWTPTRGNRGLILRETTSRVSGKVFVTFKDPDSDKVAVVNKETLSFYEDPEIHNEIWNYSRNNVRIGRLVRSLLIAFNKEFNNADIEQFVNQYKATYDFISDGLKQFDVVKGEDIVKWYDRNNYEDGGGGSLGSSCMTNVSEEFFDIYSKNSNVSLLILYSDVGHVEDGKYVSNRIKGRALLWNGTVDGEDAMLMDRVYIRHDSDYDLFKQYANSKGYWYHRSWDDITNDVTSKDCEFLVDLDEVDFDYYPYIDTMCYIDSENKIASSRVQDSTTFVCRSTSGNKYDPDSYR